MSFLNTMGFGSSLTSAQLKAIKLATNLSPSGPYEHEMKEIANMTSDRKNFHDVIEYLHQRLIKKEEGVQPEAWRALYKILVLLEFILVAAPKEITRDYYLHRINAIKDLRIWNQAGNPKYFTREDTFVNSKAIDIVDFLYAQNEGENAWKGPIAATKSLRRPPARGEGGQRAEEFGALPNVPELPRESIRIARAPGPAPPTSYRRSVAIPPSPTVERNDERFRGYADPPPSPGRDVVNEDLAKALRLSTLEASQPVRPQTAEERDLAAAIEASMKDEEERQRRLAAAAPTTPATATPIATSSSVAGPSTAPARDTSLIDFWGDDCDNANPALPAPITTDVIAAQQRQLAELKAQREELSREQMLMDKHRAEWTRLQEDWERRRQEQERELEMQTAMRAKQQYELARQQQQQQLQQQQQQQYFNQPSAWGAPAIGAYPGMPPSSAFAGAFPNLNPIASGSTSPLTPISPMFATPYSAAMSGFPMPGVASAGQFPTGHNAAGGSSNNPFADPANNFDAFLASFDPASSKRPMGPGAPLAAAASWSNPFAIQPAAPSTFLPSQPTSPASSEAPPPYTFGPR